MEDKTLIILSCLTALVVLELFALYKGMNGTLLTSVFALIGGLGGYQIRMRRDR